MSAWNQQILSEASVKKRVHWKFNPPSAPPHGGVWKRIVRSFKHVFYAVLGNRRLTDEILTTTFCLVEQSLNSRPLVPVSSNATNLDALTPNYFLLETAGSTMPSHQRADVDHRKRYARAQAYSDGIWDRWLRDYVPSLDRCSKSTTEPDRDLKTGYFFWNIIANLKICSQVKCRTMVSGTILSRFQLISTLVIAALRLEKIGKSLSIIVKKTQLVHPWQQKSQNTCSSRCETTRCLQCQKTSKLAYTSRWCFLVSKTVFVAVNCQKSWLLALQRLQKKSINWTIGKNQTSCQKFKASELFIISIVWTDELHFLFLANPKKRQCKHNVYTYQNK